jgi:6-phosphofructokinase 1
MNAAVRAVVRTGLAHGFEVLGVRRGFAGLAAGEMESLDARSVGGILQQGGTMLGSERFPEFEREEARRAALDQLTERGVEGLVVIGGNGSQRGASALSAMGLAVVGVASTIDNDLYGSEITLGVDEVGTRRKTLDPALLELARVLAR